MAKSAFNRWFEKKYEKKCGWNTKDDCRATWLTAMKESLKMTKAEIRAEIKKVEAER